MEYGYLGKCYYCKKDVLHSKPYDWGALTKKWDSKKKEYVISDYFHPVCYYMSMNSFIDRMQGKKKEEYKQLSLFEMEEQ